MSDKEIVKGDDKVFNLTFKDVSGNPLDITGYTVFFTVKTNSDYATSTDDSAAIISKTVTDHTDAVNGVTLITLTNVDTDVDAGKYVYDVQLKDADGKISTPPGVPFVFTVVKDVTRRTS